MFSKGPRIKDFEYITDLGPDVIEKISRREYNFNILKACIAILLIFLGAYFLYSGMNSESSIDLTYGKAKLVLNNVYPGLTIIIFAVLLLLFSVPKIRSKKK